MYGIDNDLFRMFYYAVGGWVWSFLIFVMFHFLNWVVGSWVSVILLSEVFCMLRVFYSLIIEKKATVLKPCCSFIKITTAKRIRNLEGNLMEWHEMTTLLKETCYKQTNRMSTALDGEDVAALPLNFSWPLFRDCRKLVKDQGGECEGKRMCPWARGRIWTSQKNGSMKCFLKWPDP